MVVALFLTAGSNAQTPPLAGRPTNFSQLIGRFKIAASIEPERVIVEDPLTLRVVITGKPAAGDPPLRAQLKILPDDLNESFFIEPRPQDDVARPEAETWEFFWKLRPKSADVREVPSMALAFFSPQVGRYQTVRSEPLPLEVVRRPSLEVEPARAVPPSFLDLAAWSPGRPPPLAFKTVACDWFATAVLFAVFGWIVGGFLARASEDSRVAQTGMAADALADLREKKMRPDEIGTRYLQARFGLNASEPTLAEVDRVLKRHGVAVDLRRSWADWFREVYAERYAQPTGERAANAKRFDEAIALVQSSEAAR